MLLQMRSQVLFNFSIETERSDVIHTGVCEKTPPEKKTGENIGFENAASGAGKQFLLLDCRAKARVKGLFVSQTPVCMGGFCFVCTSKRKLLCVYIYIYICIYIYIHINTATGLGLFYQPLEQVGLHVADFEFEPADFKHVSYCLITE